MNDEKINVTSNLHELKEAALGANKYNKIPQATMQSSVNSNNVECNLRVKFRKTGRLQYISHLDLARTMRTAIIRACIPIKYSEGFNPHPRMSFALQLSVGSESVCEFMELKLIEKPDCEKIKNALNNNLADELRILDVYEPERKPNEIEWAEYKITYYPQNGEKTPNFDDIITHTLVVSKRTKSGPKEVDIRLQILRFSQSGDVLTAVLCANNSAYLNPEYVAKLASIRDYDILRNKTFLKDGVTEFK